MEGGADTGFRHVEPEKYEPRLLRFKREGRRVQVYWGKFFCNSYKNV